MTDTIDVVNVKLYSSVSCGRVCDLCILVPICEINNVEIGICILFPPDGEYLARTINDLYDLLNEGDKRASDILEIALNFYGWSYASKRESILVFSVSGQKDFDRDFLIRVNFHQSRSLYFGAFNINYVNIKDDVTPEYIKMKRSDRNAVYDPDSVEIISTIIKNIKTIKSVKDTTKSYLLDNIEKIRLVPDCTQESI